MEVSVWYNHRLGYYYTCYDKKIFLRNLGYINGFDRELIYFFSVYPSQPNKLKIKVADTLDNLSHFIRYGIRKNRKHNIITIKNSWWYKR